MARRKISHQRASEFGFELSETAKDSIAGVFCGDPANMEVYDPREKSRIPDAGAWAMIVRQLPPIEGGLNENLRVGRLFYLEQIEGTDDAGFLRNGTYKALCRSPWGDLHLWPYEYSTFDTADVVSLWASGELVFHPLNIDSARLSEIAFYARSRGIGLADAAVMALGTLAGPVGWFEPRADLAEDCEAMERRVHSTVWPIAGWSRRVKGIK
jgi:hypothetical protein